VTHIPTERLRLRRATMDDVAAFHAILSNPTAMAYWSTPPHTDLAQTREWLAGMIDIPAKQGEDFAIVYAGRVVGKVGLYQFPEIGFIMHPDVWEQGIASEALHAVLDRAFSKHRLDAVVADVDPRNERSLRLLRKLGFREVGRRQNTWLIGDCWCDSVDLRLTHADFREARGNKKSPTCLPAGD
jgi:[ribosomal protein S5]-alanine N-acetyltransferase